MKPSFPDSQACRPCSAYFERQKRQKRQNAPDAHTRCQGFSLLEVLVAILILSLGLLGMVGMQVAALQAVREARMQSIATAFATELAELMRGSQGAGFSSGSSPYFGDFHAPLVAFVTGDCMRAPAAAACPDGLAIAQSHMTDWLARVDYELPGARVQICTDTEPFDAGGLPQWSCHAGDGAVAIIKIGWARSSGERWRGLAFAVDRATRPSVVLPFTSNDAV